MRPAILRNTESGADGPTRGEVSQTSIAAIIQVWEDINVKTKIYVNPSNSCEYISLPNPKPRGEAGGKVRGSHPLGLMNVSAISHSNPSNEWREIFILTTDHNTRPGRNFHSYTDSILRFILFQASGSFMSDHVSCTEVVENGCGLEL